MKTIEEQIGGKCIHFNGIMETHCKWGVNYKTAFGERPVLRMPCIRERMSHLKEDVIPCGKLQFPTPEEVKKQIQEQNKAFRLTLTALSAVQQYIKATGKKNGKMRCPNGDHDLSYTQAEYNGHIWMKCQSCDITMMQ